MKSLIKYLSEKLVIDKNYKNIEPIDKILDKFIITIKNDASYGEPTYDDVLNIVNTEVNRHFYYEWTSDEEENAVIKFLLKFKKHKIHQTNDIKSINALCQNLIKDNIELTEFCYDEDTLFSIEGVETDMYIMLICGGRVRMRLFICKK